MPLSTIQAKHIQNQELTKISYYQRTTKDEKQDGVTYSAQIDTP